MATLKISDLSVGDWVKYETMPTKVMYINGFDSVVRGKASNGNIVIAHIDCFEPIPITAEILEKTGVKCFYEDADTALYGTPLCSIFHTKGTLRYRLETPQASVVCWNIHDLQHALRLAGVEKEINL